MKYEKKKEQDGHMEWEKLELMENIDELKRRAEEDSIVSDLLLEEEEDVDAKKKLKKLNDLLSDIQKKLEKAEALLKDIICAQEKENLKIEDAILLSDGVMKVKENEIEKSSEKDTAKDKEHADETDA